MQIAQVTLDDVLTRLLMPVARFAMARGLGVRDLSDPMKRAFLSVADRDAERRATDSRLAAATGLQRRDVTRLRAAAPAPRAAALPARLLSAWPDVTESLRRGGDAPSFEALARGVSRDVHPRTLLDLLVAAGAIEVSGDTVRLLRRDYVPAGGSPEQLGYLADTLHDHGMAAVANVTGSAAYFDRAAHYDGLTLDEARAIAARFEMRQMDALAEVAEAAGRAQGDGDWRIRFGGYGYWEEME